MSPPTSCPPSCSSTCRAISSELDGLPSEVFDDFFNVHTSASACGRAIRTPSTAVRLGPPLGRFAAALPGAAPGNPGAGREEIRPRGSAPERCGSCKTWPVSEDDKPTVFGARVGEAGKHKPLDRGAVIGHGLFWLAKWSVCLIAIVAALWVLWRLLGVLWVVVLPVALALVVATVLWPPVRWLTAHGVRPALAATLSVLLFIGVVAGIIALIVPSVVAQAPELADKAGEGVNKVRDWLRGPPLNIRDEQLDQATDTIVDRLQSSAEQIASGVFSGVTTAGSALVTLFLVLVLAFFFVKDGPRFMPWLHSVTGSGAGRHFEEVLQRVWATLGGFIRTQA